MCLQRLRHALYPDSNVLFNLLYSNLRERCWIYRATFFCVIHSCTFVRKYGLRSAPRNQKTSRLTTSQCRGHFQGKKESIKELFHEQYEVGRLPRINQANCSWPLAGSSGQLLRNFLITCFIDRDYFTIFLHVKTSKHC